MGTKVIAIYKEGVLKPIEKLNLPEKAKVRITISGNFSRLLDEVGEIEAKEEIDKVIGSMRTRDYYGQSRFGYFIALAKIKNAILLTDDGGMHFHAKEVGVISILIREIDLKGIEKKLKADY